MRTEINGGPPFLFHVFTLTCLLGTGESNVSIVILNSVLHRSSSLSDVYLATFTGNPENYVILTTRPYRDHRRFRACPQHRTQATLERSKVY